MTLTPTQWKILSVLFLVLTILMVLLRLVTWMLGEEIGIEAGYVQDLTILYLVSLIGRKVHE